MQEEYGMAGVRFWMCWLALLICAMIVKQQRIGLAVVGVAIAVWAAFATRYLVRRIRAGATVASFDYDIDIVLCVVALALTAMVPVILLARWLHIGPRQALPLILALGGVSAAWQSW